MLLLLLPVVLAVVGAWTHRITVDDGFINYRTVDQLLAGHGPVFNAGQRVETFTSPAWLAMLVVSEIVTGRFAAIEWQAVVLGIGAAGGAVAFALAAGLRLWGPPGRDTLLIPAGALAVVAFPPFWPWATAGLGTSLVFCWQAAVFWGLVRRERAPGGAAATPADRPRWLPILIGVGVLVRPDLLPFVVAFAAVLLVRSDATRSRVAAIGWCVSVPLVYQVFRMGYYGAVVPNTALTKEGLGSNWSHGWRYLGDISTTYAIWPCLAGLGVLVVLAARRASQRIPGAQLVVLAPVVGALLHVLWVARVGGDYIHGRFALPGAFALALPVALVPFTRIRSARVPSMTVASGVATAVVVAWALVQLVRFDVLRPPDEDDPNRHGSFSVGDNPVVAEDYPVPHATGLAFRAAADADADVVIDASKGPQVELPGLPGGGVRAFTAGLGVVGFTAGTEVHVSDVYTLADPIGSRGPRVAASLPGHQKAVEFALFRARYGAFTDEEDPRAAAGRRALDCGEVARIIEAVDGPLTLSRFVENVFAAPSLSAVRFEGEDLGGGIRILTSPSLEAEACAAPTG